MKTNTVVFFVFLLFAISSLKYVWADDDELFDFDNEFESLSTTAFDEDSDEVEEFEVNKHKAGNCNVRLRHDHYPAHQGCVRNLCVDLCNDSGFTQGKCRKSKNDVKKACYCHKDCKKPATPDDGSSTPSSPPAVSPTPNDSPVYPPAPSPAPVASPVYSPAASPAPVATPASSPAPSDTPCDDDVPSRPKKPSSVEEFSDEDFDFIFS